MLRVLHLLLNVHRINYGVWNSAIFGRDQLLTDYGVFSYFWSCDDEASVADLGFIVHYLDTRDRTRMRFTDLLRRSFDPRDTVVVSHSSWGMPTRLGFFAAKAGFKWIYTPHGMLEPWSVRQGFFKKKLYFLLFEARYVKYCEAIRAVSSPEQQRLQSTFRKKAVLIHNGVEKAHLCPKSMECITVLFMARLHHKKGVVPLVLAWAQATKAANVRITLVIAGPDEGELEKIRPYFSGSIVYAGAVYAEAKEKLLAEAHYFILPSFSEGFPTSVIEAMAYGAIPLISEGCNFPEVLDLKIGLKAEPNVSQLVQLFKMLSRSGYESERSKAASDYIQCNYSSEVLLAKFHELYAGLLT